MYTNVIINWGQNIEIKRWGNLPKLDFTPQCPMKAQNQNPSWDTLPLVCQAKFVYSMKNQVQFLCQDMPGGWGLEIALSPQFTKDISIIWSAANLVNLVLECHRNFMLYHLTYHGLKLCTFWRHPLQTLHHYSHAYGWNMGQNTRTFMSIRLEYCSIKLWKREYPTIKIWCFIYDWLL